jgi:hypothetical protein
MIRKYNVYEIISCVLPLPPKERMKLLGQVEGEEWFGARENASVKFKLPREKIELEEFPQDPHDCKFDSPWRSFAKPKKGQRPPPAVTPHLRKAKPAKKAPKKGKR